MSERMWEMVCLGAAHSHNDSELKLVFDTYTEGYLCIALSHSEKPRHVGVECICY